VTFDLRFVLPAALLLVARASWAQSSLVERYDVPASCPTALWFEAELRRRGPSPANWEGAVQVSVEAHGARFVGHVQRAGPSAVLDAREVEHESCEQVVRALALIASLLLTPSAGGTPSGPHARSDAGDTEKPSSPNAPKTSAPAGGSAPNAASAPRPQRPWRLEHGMALGLAVQSSIAPDVRVGPRLGYRLLIARAGSESELGVSFARIQSGSIDAAGVGSAELTYSAGRVRLCHAVPLLGSLWLAPCGVLDVGELRGVGSTTGKDRVTRSALWLSPGLLGKLELRPRRPLFMEVAAGAFFPLSRPEFHFTHKGPPATEQLIYETPKNLGFSANLSFGVLFP